jgi:hypothetical protein
VNRAARVYTMVRGRSGTMRYKSGVARNYRRKRVRARTIGPRIGPSGETDGNRGNYHREDDSSASEPEPSEEGDDPLDPEPDFRRHPTSGSCG